MGVFTVVLLRPLNVPYATRIETANSESEPFAVYGLSALMRLFAPMESAIAGLSMVSLKLA
jgi:hypothetical protein